MNDTASVRSTTAVSRLPPPVTLPDTSPYSGGFPERTLSGALRRQVQPSRSGTFLRGHAALAIVTELAQHHADHMREHVPQLLTLGVLHVDSTPSLVADHARRLLLLLLREFVLKPAVQSGKVCSYFLREIMIYYLFLFVYSKINICDM